MEQDLQVDIPKRKNSESTEPCPPQNPPAKKTAMNSFFGGENTNIHPPKSAENLVKS